MREQRRKEEEMKECSAEGEEVAEKYEVEKSKEEEMKECRGERGGGGGGV